MAGVPNSKFGPPPLATPITGTEGDNFGVPFQHRPTDPLPAGSLAVSWASWFNADFQYTVLAPRMVSTTQANLSKLANYLSTADAAAAANFSQSTAPVSLGTAPFLVIVTDYNHVLQWTGTGWQWGPGERGSGEGPVFCEVDPTGVGWHLYDGSTVNYLKSDGTTGSVTLPDLTSITANAAFTVAGSPNGGPNAAVAPGFSGGTIASAATGITATTSATATTQAETVTGASTVPTAAHTHAVNITDPHHTHTFSGGSVDATGEPRNLVRRPWFRQ